MPKVRVSPDGKNQAKKVLEIVEGTKIIKREFELEYGTWNFIVAGPDNEGNIVVREGYAQHMNIQTLPLYSAMLGKPDIMGVRGIPLEDFIDDDIPDEMHGLELYRVDPVRPLTVSKKWTAKGNMDAEDIISDYRDGVKALISTPDEKFWYLSVITYLNECNDYFPDSFIQGIKEGNLSLKAKIVQPKGLGWDNRLFN